MDLMDFLNNPPEGTELIAFNLRQAVANVEQLQTQYQTHQQEGEQLRARLNHAAGAADALKSLAIQAIKDSTTKEDSINTAISDNGVHAGAVGVADVS